MRAVVLCCVVCEYRSITRYVDCMVKAVAGECGEEAAAWQRNVTMMMISEADFDQRCPSIHTPPSHNSNSPRLIILYCRLILVIDAGLAESLLIAHNVNE